MYNLVSIRHSKTLYRTKNSKYIHSCFITHSYNSFSWYNYSYVTIHRH